MGEKHAWYSKKMADYRINFYKSYNEIILPYFIYLDKDGNEIKATLITDIDLHRTNWDDMEYLGRVFKFVRNE